MEIIPAIDLRGGNCVRLHQGNYKEETVFSFDPVEKALEWQSLGAPRLHIVDLDGASTGELCHLDTIKEIVNSVSVPIQLGGGIRRLETIKELLQAGVERVILGTAAVENQSLIEEACHNFGEFIIIGVDAHEGYIAIHGWRTPTEFKTLEFAQSMVELGAKRLIYTDNGRDGTLTEPDFVTTDKLVNTVEVPVIVAGGISSLEHLSRLENIGAEGVIIGQALYTGAINLKQALATVH